MQPYFLPYAGYYQLIASVDLFVVYDNIKYTKKGWINRNRLLQNGTDAMFTLPLSKDSDSLDIRDRKLIDNFDKEKFLRKFEGAYKQAQYFEQTFDLLRQVVYFPKDNLFDFIHNSLVETCRHLYIDTKIIVSSEIDINHQLHAQDKVIALCNALGAKEYINAIGGIDLYSRERFQEDGIQLRFIQPRVREYAQNSNAHISSLSIVDMMMFSPIEIVVDCINADFELI
jgi:hypothetical protein